jgi:hypothetical protein
VSNRVGFGCIKSSRHNWWAGRASWTSSTTLIPCHRHHIGSDGWHAGPWMRHCSGESWQAHIGYVGSV